jgi:Ca2+-binding RTX toxin-like protein
VANAGPINFGYAVTNRPHSNDSQLYILNLDLGAGIDLGRVSDRNGQGFKLIDVAVVNVPDTSPNYLNGGVGNDFLVGDAGNDTLIGGSGNNTFQSSAGNDHFVGGHDADTFVFNTGKPFSSNQPAASGPGATLVSSPTSLGLTTLVNFQPALDKIVLDKTTFTQLQSGPGAGFSQATDFAVADTDAAASAGIATITYSRASGKLFYSETFYSETGIGSRPQTVRAFAQLSHAPQLTAADFQIAA